MARSTVLLKPNVVNILYLNFCEQKFVQHGSKTIAMTVTASHCLFSKKNDPNYATGPKSAPNSDSFWMRRLFNVCVRVFSVPNVTILFVYIAAKIKMSFIWKHDFLAKICIFCKSIADPLSEAYTQPYPFGAMIKLIISQIRHELSATIHEITTSWKKTLDSVPYISSKMLKKIIVNKVRMV